MTSSFKFYLRRWPDLLAIGLFATMAQAALAGPPRAETYLPIDMTVVNEGAEALECQAVAGHWFSFDLGIGAHGEKLRFDMSVDPKTGTVVMFNSMKDAVPIESVFCGINGRAWETRFVFPLRRIAEKAAIQPASHFTCRMERETTTCS
jgi:hypothetical protein